MKKHLLSLILISICFVNNIYGEFEGKKNLPKTNGTPDFTFFDINNISTYIFNDGGTDFNINQGPGFEYPKGSLKFIVFSSGLVWGAKVNNQVRVGGSTYRQGLVGGKIKSDGTPEKFYDDNVRVYRVRRDFKDFNNRDNIDVSSEIYDGQGTAQQIREQYIKDWNEWPAEDGAPFEDTDANGSYDPEVDIPGIPGADQTIWYVANDFDSYFTFELYGSQPFGLEMQATFWGYSNGSPADNIMFRRYVLINKSEYSFEDMYLSLWMDPDIGDPEDDLVGCDTVLNLGYAYNSTYFDAIYGNDAPAIGFKILQGPKVPASQDDYASFYGRHIPGMKNLNMNSFHFTFKCCAPRYGDPDLSVYETGTLDWYEYMKGNLRTGDPFLIPSRLGGGSSAYPFSGDPVANTGWLDGVEVDPGDRRVGVGSGPFTMAPGDTQEVMYAHIVAGGSNGVHSLTAVSLLKQYAEYSQYLYDSDFITGLEIESPDVKFYELDKAISLTWGNNTNSIRQVENYNINGYTFQGYNVYQFSYPAEETKDAVKIATYDIADGITQVADPGGKTIDGSDSGIKRKIIVDNDYLLNTELVNGKKYYFGVTSYAYNPEAEDGFKIAESFPEIFRVVPRGFSPGFSSVIGLNQNIEVEHISGGSDAEVTASVLSPQSLNGDTYELSFQNGNAGLEISVKDINEDAVVFSGLRIEEEEIQNITFDGVSMEINNTSNGSNSYFPISESDVFKFSTTAKSFDKTKAAKETEQINIFPNPYYYQVESTGILQYPDFVTISHLPQRAEIRVYNLHGQLMKKLDKNSQDQFFTWDLFTKWGRRIPSGLYIIYIEMPDIGATKILKLAVI